MTDQNPIFDDIPIKGATGDWQTISGVAAGSTVSSVGGQDDSLVLVEKLKQELNLSWPADEVLDRRFKNIILASLKEIRTGVQTHDVLTKGAAVGGLGLSEEQGSKIISWLRKQAKGGAREPASKPERAAFPEIKPEIRPKIVTPEPEVIKKPAPPPPAVSEKPSEPIKKFTEKDLEHEIAPPTPAVQVSPTRAKAFAGLEALIRPKAPASAKVDIPQAAAPVVPQVPAPKAPLAKKPDDRYLSRGSKPFISQPAVAPGVSQGGFFSSLKAKLTLPRELKTGDETALSALAGGKATAKPAVAPAPPSREKITDIKIPARLTGPLEELQNLRLADWRQLDIDPLKVALKIKDKIDLLAAQSFSKKMEGIEAWQKSEVNRLYLALGKQSVEQNKTLEQAVADRQAKNQAFLTKEEFLALGKLNKMLEY